VHKGQDKQGKSRLSLKSQLGGKIELGEEGSDKLVASVDLSGKKVTDADLADLADLKSLKVLNLTPTQITDAGLVHLRRLNNLLIISHGIINEKDTL
jgi:hypothetical protein